jgi:hypothetical protein
MKFKVEPALWTVGQANKFATLDEQVVLTEEVVLIPVKEAYRRVHSELRSLHAKHNAFDSPIGQRNF